MGRRIVRAGLVAAAAVTLLAVPWAGPAAAGGGCHRGPTQGEGTSIEMMKLCFTPSILHVDPGAEVTFTNQDPMGHNVTASGWGQFDAMLRGEAFSATFAEPGVYPFACSYHPGMTGAVVVGNGQGAGSGQEVAVGSLEDPTETKPAPAAEVATAENSTGSGSAPVGWVGGGVIGLVIGAGLGLLRGRTGASGR
jgi:plastocyanin